MRFLRTEEQAAFAGALHRLLESADVPSAARAWADGGREPGRALWDQVAQVGVHGLLVPEGLGGLDATPVELVVAMEEIGRAAAPGPWAESVAFLPVALAGVRDETVEALASGAMGTVAVLPEAPFALDADFADHVFVLAEGRITGAVAETPQVSIDPTRRLLYPLAPTEEGCEAPAAGRAFDLAVLATAAQLLGCGERILTDSLAYVKQRRQFGREIGSYQAVKHALADVRIALDFARPLVEGAAVDVNARSVSAAKVAAGDAAHRASRVGLQVHGAVGYTAELDLSLWLLKVRALMGAWGGSSFHRARIADVLVTDRLPTDARVGIPS